MTATAETTHHLTTTLVILDDAGERALLQRKDDAWTLPIVHTRDHWYAEVTPIVGAVRELFGMDVSAVRCIRARKSDRTTRVVWVTQAEGEAPAATAGVEWAPLASLPPDLAAEDERAAIDQWIASGPAHTPWLRPGWRRKALGWAIDTLAECGRRVNGEPQQFRHWGIASIWRIPTDRGDAWFKAVPPMFAYEGELIELIAPSMPEHLPNVITANRDRGWTLLEALPVSRQDGVPQWKRDTSGPEWEEAVRVLARLQQAWIGREAALFAAGCTDRRLDTLPAAIEELLASEAVRAGLSDDERTRVAAFAEGVPARIEALRACGVPETLMHGDFHAGNVAADGNRTVIYDWTDGCVGHPFFDMATFLATNDPVERAALVQAYLDAWQDVAPAEQVERAWELAEPLACVHHALSYMRIFDAVEPGLRFELDADVTFWLRWLRELLAEA